MLGECRVFSTEERQLLNKVRQASARATRRVTIAWHNLGRVTHLLTSRPPSGEATTCAKEGRAHREDHGNDSADSEPVGVAESGLVAVVLEAVLEDVPKNHVNDEDDNAGQSAEEAEERHDDRREARGAGNANEAEEEREERQETSNGVEDERLGQVVEDVRVHLDPVAVSCARRRRGRGGDPLGVVKTCRLKVVPDAAVGTHFRRSLEAQAEDTIDVCASAGLHIEEGDPVPHGGRERRK